MTPKSRSRLILLLIALVFFGSFGVAGLLRFSGWMPSGSTNYGTLLTAPIDLRAVPVSTSDGAAYPWQSAQMLWRIAVFPPADCAEPCVLMSQALERVWRTEGRHAERLQVLWFGALPEGAASFRNLLPMHDAPEIRARLAAQAGAGELPVYLIDPHGFLVMRYDSGFDAAGLRRDLGKLLQLK